MMSKSLVILALSSVTLLCGCASSSHLVVGETRPEIDESEVKIYYRPPARYEEVALLDASSRGSLAVTNQGKMNTVIEKFKEEAAELGANGVLLSGIGDQSTGSADEGNATRNSFGKNTTIFGTGLAHPFAHKSGSAIAIYVLQEVETPGRMPAVNNAIAPPPPVAVGSRHESLALADAAVPLPDWLDDASIVAADATFLGCVTKDLSRGDSIANTSGIHGSASGQASIFNPSGPYGAVSAANSPWNEHSRAAPRLVSRDGTQWVYLSANPLNSPRVDPYALVAYVKTP